MIRLFSDQRGTTTLEYLLLLTSLTIGMATALYLLGPGLVEVFVARFLWLALPSPLKKTKLPTFFVKRRARPADNDSSSKRLGSLTQTNSFKGTTS